MEHMILRPSHTGPILGVLRGGQEWGNRGPSRRCQWVAGSVASKVTQIARGESGGAGQIPAWKPQGGTVDVLPFAAFVFHKGVWSGGVRLLWESEPAVCVRRSERERERERGRTVCVCVCERERVCVRGCERDREGGVCERGTREPL